MPFQTGYGPQAVDQEQLKKNREFLRAGHVQSADTSKFLDRETAKKIRQDMNAK